MLRNQCRISVVTPSSASPSEDTGWCFPDTEAGIRNAIDRGATHLWANTILFASHPLQVSSYLDRYKDQIRVVGQPPLLVEKFDNKEFVNSRLRANGSFPMPQDWTVSLQTDPKSFLQTQNFPSWVSRFVDEAVRVLKCAIPSKSFMIIYDLYPNIRQLSCRKSFCQRKKLLSW